MQVKLSEFSVIPITLLSAISGGKDDNPAPPSVTPTVTVVGGGNANGGAGVIMTAIPITSNTTATPFIMVDTVNGVNGGGAMFAVKF